MAFDDRFPEDDGATGDDVMAVVRALVGRGRAIAGTGGRAVGTGAEEAVRQLVGRRVGRAVRLGAATVSTGELLEALDPRSAAAMPAWAGTAVARLARTRRVAKAVGGRTPLGLAVQLGPAVYAAVSGNLRGLDAAAGRLVTRARQRRIDPDPERLHRVLVQALVGDPIDPEADADHGALLRVWLADAGRRAVPFGLDRISGLRNGRTPEAVAAVLDAVDVARLARG